MKRSTLVPAAAAACAAALLLTGCGGSGEATAVGDGAPAAAEVDTAALDPGDFPTTPQPEFGYATAAKMAMIEGQRMAEFVPIPFEIDPVLTSSSMPTGPLKGAGALSLVLSGDAEKIAEDNGMMMGFSVAADDGGGVNSARSVVHAVLRFPNTEAASTAARELHQNALAPQEYLPPSTEEHIDILPNTLVSSSETEGSDYAVASKAALAFTAHGDYVINTYSQSPPESKDTNAQTIAKALELQVPMLDAFPATPKGEAGKVKLDQAGVIRLTIPDTGEHQSVASMADYGPRGMAQRSTNPPMTYKLLTEVGAEHNGSDKTTVYQADTAEGAQKIRDTFADDMVATTGYSDAPGVPGLPDSQCYTKDTPLGTQQGCIIANGRYAAEASGMDDMKSVHQMMAAQYLILEHAE